MEQPLESAPTALDRRRFVQAAAAAMAATGLGWPAAAWAGRDGDRRATPPKPIPGGFEFGGTLFHTWAPGPETLTLPFSGGQPQGLDVDPGTLTDFSGFAAMAYHVGSAQGGALNLETDVRAYQGAYVDGTGTRRFGTFAFI
jgi:hypothetical protein